MDNPAGPAADHGNRFAADLRKLRQAGVEAGFSQRGDVHGRHAIGSAGYRPACRDSGRDTRRPLPETAYKSGPDPPLHPHGLPGPGATGPEPECRSGTWLHRAPCISGFPTPAHSAADRRWDQRNRASVKTWSGLRSGPRFPVPCPRHRCEKTSETVFAPWFFPWVFRATSSCQSSAPTGSTKSSGRSILSRKFFRFAVSHCQSSGSIGSILASVWLYPLWGPRKKTLPPTMPTRGPVSQNIVRVLGDQRRRSRQCRRP